MNYTVQPGDSLSKIALKLLGPSGTWQDMLRFNPDISDPNLIYAGQSLYIPDDALVSTAASSAPSSGTAATSSLSTNELLYLAAGLIVLGAVLFIPKKKDKLKAQAA